MAAAPALAGGPIGDIDAFADALCAAGLAAWPSAIRAARTFQGRVERGGGWEQVGLETQLEQMRRARPFAAWLLVTGRLTATADFLALADLRLGLCARKHLSSRVRRGPLPCRGSAASAARAMSTPPIILTFHVIATPFDSRLGVAA